MGADLLCWPAAQYGGSEAHSTIFKQQRGDWEYATSIGDKLTSLRRFYSNTYTDAEKQDALNLFLGNYIPLPGQPAIWDLDSDYYLHSGQGPGSSLLVGVVLISCAQAAHRLLLKHSCGARCRNP